MKCRYGVIAETLALTLIGCETLPVNFFFQAEDGIRDLYVTGVQTCALPICHGSGTRSRPQEPALARLRREKHVRGHLPRLGGLQPVPQGDSGGNGGVHRLRQWQETVMGGG